ncbi:hypothetical protein BSZ35_11620 [Salinibacter sp. 10B]|nr:hypothetical protein BSZ35_11620 [Salinibacter sp. 10B]
MLFNGTGWALGAIVLLFGSPIGLAGGVVKAQSADLADSPCYPDHRMTRQHLQGRQLRTLSLTRNAIYARAGYEFSTIWIDKHFRSHAWYEPGSFDPDALSARDKHNAKLIAEFEAELTLGQLRARRAVHWRLKEKVPPIEWDRVWNRPEARMEAHLLKSAITNRQSSAEDARPAPSEAPSGFANSLRIGTAVEALPESVERSNRGGIRFEGSVADTTLLQWGPRVAAYADSTGHLRQVVAEVRVPFSRPELMEPARDEQEARDFAALDREILAIVDRLGEPTHYGNLQWTGPEPYDPMRWKSGEYIAEVWPLFDSGLAQDATLVLHTGAPDRLCGAKDGFDAWFDRFTQALEEGNTKQLADYFHFPFGDGSNPTLSSPTFRRQVARSFPDRQTFLREVPDTHPLDPQTNTDLSSPWSLALDDPFETKCHPYLGHLAPTKNGGRYVFQRIEGRWAAVGIE